MQTQISWQCPTKSLPKNKLKIIFDFGRWRRRGEEIDGWQGQASQQDQMLLQNILRQNRVLRRAMFFFLSCVKTNLNRFPIISMKQICNARAVLVRVKWSAWSPSTVTIWAQILLRVLFYLERMNKNEKEVGNGPFKKQTYPWTFGDQAVNVVTFYSDGLGSNPAEGFMNEKRVREWYI